MAGLPALPGQRPAPVLGRVYPERTRSKLTLLATAADEDMSTTPCGDVSFAVLCGWWRRVCRCYTLGRIGSR